MLKKPLHQNAELISDVRRVLRGQPFYGSMITNEQISYGVKKHFPELGEHSRKFIEQKYERHYSYRDLASLYKKDYTVVRGLIKIAVKNLAFLIGRDYFGDEREEDLF